MTVLRILWCLLTATTYQLVTNPFLQALLLLLCGHWLIAVLEVGAWLALCAIATTLSHSRSSRIVPDLDVFTTPDSLFLLGNEQEGNAPLWYRSRHPEWSRWLCAFVFMAWRNKLRNLPFCRPLLWLHRPAGELVTREWRIRGVLIRMRSRGWMVELEYATRTRFGDFGPRLDQPDQWGGISWAFRPYGRK